MRCAVINANGVVENIIIADPNVDAIEGKQLVAADIWVDIGFLYNGGVFTGPNPPPAPPAVPESITRRQCAKQLLVLGMISAQEAIDMTQSGKPPAMVQAYLDNMAEPDRTFATIDFAADNYLRNNPLLTTLMAANGMTDQQVDEYFIAASQL